MAERDRGILSGPLDLDGPRRARDLYPNVPAATGLVVEHRASGLVGAVVRIDSTFVTLRDRRGRECPIRLLPGGFALEGSPVSLVAPPPPDAGTARTASGSVAVVDLRALVARPGRILVEGIHDAELVEKVWGDDLRVEGVVVERLDGIAHLAEPESDHYPGPGRRGGVLRAHLVPGSKEARAAAALTSVHVLVTGTPYVDVWQAIKPEVVGLTAWPVIPKGRSWKEGVCAAFGEPEPSVLWRRLLSQVTTYADLEPPLVGAVEALIDFVTGT
jgi:hypothetical protein